MSKGKQSVKKGVWYIGSKIKEKKKDKKDKKDKKVKVFLLDLSLL